MSDFDKQLTNATDAVLALSLKHVRNIVSMLSMADLADMRIADSDSDRVLDRNFDRTQSARNTLAKIEAEIARRAQLNAASAPNGQASGPTITEADRAQGSSQ